MQQAGVVQEGKFSVLFQIGLVDYEDDSDEETEEEEGEERDTASEDIVIVSSVSPPPEEIDMPSAPKKAKLS